MERHEMTTTFRHNRSPVSPSTVSPPLLLAVAVVALTFCGCRAPLFHKEQHFTVYQYGVNTVTSELLKEEDISPQIKASLK